MKKVLLAASCFAMACGSASLQGCDSKAATSMASLAAPDPNAALVGTWENVDHSSSWNFLPGQTLKISLANGNPGAGGTWSVIRPGVAQVNLNMGIGMQALTAELKGDELSVTDGSQTETFKRCSTDCTST